MRSGMNEDYEFFMGGVIIDERQVIDISYDKDRNLIAITLKNVGSTGDYTRYFGSRVEGSERIIATLMKRANKVHDERIDYLLKLSRDLGLTGGE